MSSNLACPVVSERLIGYPFEPIYLFNSVSYVYYYYLKLTELTFLRRRVIIKLLEFIFMFVNNKNINNITL